VTFSRSVVSLLYIAVAFGFQIKVEHRTAQVIAIIDVISEI
jgi:hypothetical protein